MSERFEVVDLGVMLAVGDDYRGGPSVGPRGFLDPMVSRLRALLQIGENDGVGVYGALVPVEKLGADLGFRDYMREGVLQAMAVSTGSVWGFWAGHDQFPGGIAPMEESFLGSGLFVLPIFVVGPAGIRDRVNRAYAVADGNDQDWLNDAAINNREILRAFGAAPWGSGKVRVVRLDEVENQQRERVRCVLDLRMWGSLLRPVLERNGSLGVVLDLSSTGALGFRELGYPRGPGGRVMVYAHRGRVLLPFWTFSDFTGQGTGVWGRPEDVLVEFVGWTARFIWVLASLRHMLGHEKVQVVPCGPDCADPANVRALAAVTRPPVPGGSWVDGDTLIEPVRLASPKQRLPSVLLEGFVFEQFPDEARMGIMAMRDASGRVVDASYLYSWGSTASVADRVRATAQEEGVGVRMHMVQGSFPWCPECSCIWLPGCEHRCERLGRGKCPAVISGPGDLSEVDPEGGMAPDQGFGDPRVRH